MKTELAFQSAFVLHARPYRESSQLIELFTEGAGRISLVARGSRSSRSPLKALLQPFVPLRVSWRGRGDLKTLEQVEAVGLPLALRDTLLFSALYLNELLYRLLERNTPHEVLFVNYLRALHLLAASEDPQPVLRHFELMLLEQLGYGIDLTHTADDGVPIEADHDYLYLAEYGLVPAASSQGGENRFAGHELLALQHRCFESAEVLAAAKRFCRLALRPYLGERPLKSRELFTSRTMRTKT